MEKLKQEIVVITEYQTSLTFAEFCDCCGLSANDIQSLIEYDILSKQDVALELRIFTLQELRRVKMALRLQRDLELNLEGVTVVLDLLQELEELRVHMRLIKKHYW